MNTFKYNNSSENENQEEKIIQEYLLPKPIYGTSIYQYNIYGMNLTSCDFNLDNNKGDSIFLSSSVPSSLKNETYSNPHLILFYYNDNDTILNSWCSSIKKMISDPELYKLNSEDLPDKYKKRFKRIEFKTINLDLERNVYETFRNLKFSNPFHWAKIIEEKEKLPFILFYIETFPVEYFSITDLESDFVQKFKNRYLKSNTNNIYESYYVKKDIEKEVEKKRDEKSKVFETMNKNYFKAMKDSDDGKIKKGKYYRIVEVHNQKDKYLVEEIN